jgi:hypothetical protein
MAKSKIVVLCDGTWCGRETDTQSNIYFLADMMRIDMISSTGEDDVHLLDRPGVKARYADGVGLGSTFLDYLFNGATGHDIAKECTNVYRYIVENYTGNEEIWMFGLSRGAFTVRCVAGMINNCGIVDPRKNSRTMSATKIDTLCKEVYGIYRSHYSVDHPKSKQMKEFRKKASHEVKTPVKFMGLFDTVGSLGIPRFTGGVGFEWPEFYDQQVSSVVEKVYHAVSMHDRLWIFEPCLALRRKKTQRANQDLQIEQKWFPGAHYDLGRQKFRFFRAGKPGSEGYVSKFLNLFGHTIEPNQVCADLVLKWMMEAIKDHDPQSTLIPQWDGEHRKVVQRINDAEKKGSGDVYGEPLRIIPFGKAISLASHVSGLLGRAITSILGVRSIVEILFAVKDRRIPDKGTKIYDYKVQDASLGPDTGTIEALAGLDERRYPSRTYESFQLFRSVAG